MGGRGGSSHRATGGGGFSRARQFLESAYGLDHANAILAILSAAPNYIQEMWRDYASAFRADPNADAFDTDAFYSPADNNVHLGIGYIALGDGISTPYSVLYHEYGHMTDYLIAKSHGFNYSSYSEMFRGVDSSGNAILGYDRSGGLLGRTAKNELEGHIRRIQQQNPNLTREQAAHALIRETNGKFSLKNRSDISDIMEGSGIGVEYPLGSGHGLSYWVTRDNGKEIFAEITSAEAAHPGSLSAIRAYFPETYKVYQTMVKARKKK